MRMFSRNDAAYILGVSKSAILTMLKSGRIKASNITGGRKGVRIHQAELERIAGRKIGSVITSLERKGLIPTVKKTPESNAPHYEMSGVIQKRRESEAEKNKARNCYTYRIDAKRRSIGLKIPEDTLSALQKLSDQKRESKSDIVGRLIDKHIRKKARKQGFAYLSEKETPGTEKNGGDLFD